MLLVAVAIVLAAVIGQFVFGLDLIQSPEAAPQVSFSEDYDSVGETLNLTHESGDALVVRETEVAVSGGYGNETWANDDGLEEDDEEVTSSEAIQVTNVSRTATVRVIWTSPETDDGYVVHRWDGPEAEAEA